MMERFGKNKDKDAAVNAPVKGLFSPEEMLDKFGVDVGQVS